MTHNEIEQYLKDKDLNTFEYQLAMDAMLFAEQKTIERACELIKENIDIYAEVAINLKSSYPEIVMRNTFEKNFKQAMEE